MQPGSAHNQEPAEHSCKHAGILSGFDVAEDASDEAPHTAEEADREKDNAGNNQNVGDWGVGEMVHGFPFFRRSAVPETRQRNERALRDSGEASYAGSLPPLCMARKRTDRKGPENRKAESQQAEVCAVRITLTAAPRARPRGIPAKGTT